MGYLFYNVIFIQLERLGGYMMTFNLIVYKDLGQCKHTKVSFFTIVGVWRINDANLEVEK